MVTHKFIQGLDYGPRDGTLGLEFHMSEGGDGLASGFLAQKAGESKEHWHKRVNGVSCHVAILTTGKIIQMVDFDHCNGNLNPEDRAKEYGYYGHSTIVDVLGDHWPDPNMWSLSAELAGYRSKATAPKGEVPGPTDAQVEAAIAWGTDMKSRFPTLRGAYGHHDQSPKGCPGTTPNMKAIFDGLGGHGLWEADMAPVIVSDEAEKIVTTAAGSTWFELDGKTVVSTGHPALGPRPSPFGVGTKRAIFVNTGSNPVRRRLVLIVPAVPPVDPPG